MPAREVSYLAHKGTHSGLQDSFFKLIRWISENGYELMGPGVAVFHNDTVIVRSGGDLITELQPPVRKKD